MTGQRMQRFGQARVRRLVEMSSLALLLGTGATVRAQEQTAIANGTFESPAPPARSYILVPVGRAIPGWTVVGDAAEIGIVDAGYAAGGVTFAARGGNAWLDLTGTTMRSAGVAQRVVTIPGLTYQLSYHVGNVVHRDIFGRTSTVIVLIDGQVVARSTHGGGTSTGLDWRRFEVTFAAKGPTTDIVFINGDPAGDNSNGLDDVTLRAVSTSRSQGDGDEGQGRASDRSLADAEAFLDTLFRRMEVGENAPSDVYTPELAALDRRWSEVAERYYAVADQEVGVPLDPLCESLDCFGVRLVGRSLRSLPDGRAEALVGYDFPDISSDPPSSGRYILEFTANGWRIADVFFSDGTSFAAGLREQLVEMEEKIRRR